MVGFVGFIKLRACFRRRVGSSYFCSASGSVALPRSRRVVASSYFDSSQNLSMWLVAGVAIEL